MLPNPSIRNAKARKHSFWKNEFDRVLVLTAAAKRRVEEDRHSTDSR